MRGNGKQIQEVRSVAGNDYPMSEPDLITAEQIAAAEALAGRPETTEEQRLLMQKSLTAMRQKLLALRTAPQAEGMSPALRFATRPAAPPLADHSSVTFEPGPLPDFSGDRETLAFASATDLARLLKAGRVTSRALTEMYLARLKKFGPRLHCVVNLVPDDVALAKADVADREIKSGNWRGPLHGIPYGAKDLLATRELPTTFGAAPYRHQYLGYDATVLQRLEAAGAILAAKLSMGELAMEDTWFGGRTRNPWRPDEGSSGSSAGSGSAVAAGLVGFALGTETWGSIVSPSFVCGVTGFRPTYGRVSRHGAMALSWSMDKIGPMCRSVEDCAYVFSVIQGWDGLDLSVAETAPFAWDASTDISDMRIGIDTMAFDELETSEKMRPLKPFYDSAVCQIEEISGRPLIPVRLPERSAAYDALPMLIIGVEGAASFASLMASGGLDELAQQEDWNWPNIFRTAATIPATEYLQAQRVRSHLQSNFAEAVCDVDVYVTVPRLGPSLSYTNLTGHPEIVVRCGRTDEGLPVSLSIVGGLFRDDAALRVSHAYEKATDWNREWPDL
jgi:Asp-tRNA(Asn)/Glu-tRNA(Gln) amidotransferase A subunit family amidase